MGATFPLIGGQSASTWAVGLLLLRPYHNASGLGSPSPSFAAFSCPSAPQEWPLFLLSSGLASSSDQPAAYIQFTLLSISLQQYSFPRRLPHSRACPSRLSFSLHGSKFIPFILLSPLGLCFNLPRFPALSACPIQSYSPGSPTGFNLQPK